MKQVIQNYRTGVVAVQDVPAPTVRPGSIVVANGCSLISAGTEKSTVTLAQKSLINKARERPDLVRKLLAKARKDGLAETMRLAWARLDSPAALGYSCAGIVADVDADVEGLAVGDRVACAGQNYASHAEVVCVPKRLCVRVPDGVSWEEASFVTLGAIALQGVRQAEPRLGDRVAVIGLGLLGQLTVQLLKASGCLVLGADPDPAKLALAASLGADAVASPDDLTRAASAFTDNHGVDAVLITASTKDSGPVVVAGEISRRKGRVVVVGAVDMHVPREAYYRKELELRLSTSYGPGRYDAAYEEQGHDYPFAYVRWTEQRNMEAFLALVQQKRVSVTPLITHRFGIDDAVHAYDLMLEGREPYLGICIEYPLSPPAALRRSIRVESAPAVGDVARIGVIGAGNHVQDALLPRLLGMKGVAVSAICTGTGIKGKTLADKVRAELCTTDYRDVLKDQSITAVLIGTRHDTHARIVVEALAAGKHVFVEKPLCLSEPELDAIIAQYERSAASGLHLMVGFNRRFSSHAEKAKAFFSGRTGPLTMIYRVNAGALPPEHWVHDLAIGGGRIVGEACHFVDYLQFLCGAPPVSVHATAARGHEGVIPDQAVLSLTFADGSVGAIIYTASGDAALSKERVEVFGDGRSLVMDDFTVTHGYAAGRRTTLVSGKRDKGFEQELTRFIAAVSQGGPAPLAFAEIESVTRTCLLAAESLTTGEVYSV
jgi:predicted dehydrogenase